MGHRVQTKSPEDGQRRQLPGKVVVSGPTVEVQTRTNSDAQVHQQRPTTSRRPILIGRRPVKPCRPRHAVYQHLQNISTAIFVLTRLG